MHFHGFKYQFPSDGSYIPGESGPGANVAVGRGFVYRLEAKRGSAGVWPYHDHSSSMTTSIDGGMYGALSILGRDQKEPDRENVVFFSTHLGFMTINGRAFVGNTPTFHAKPGNVVQWDVLALGSEHHTFHLHGHRWNWNGDLDRHADDRPGGELPLPHQGGRARDVVLPLPRRDPHDARDAGLLPGAGPVRRALVLVALVALAAPAASLAAERQVSIHSNTFIPMTVRVIAGDTVRWTNHDFVGHDVQSDDAGATFGSGVFGHNASYPSPVLGTPGTIPYHCQQHLFMHGTVAVYDIWLGTPATTTFGSNAKFTGLAAGRCERAHRERGRRFEGPGHRERAGRVHGAHPRSRAGPLPGGRRDPREHQRQALGQAEAHDHEGQDPPRALARGRQGHVVAEPDTAPRPSSTGRRASAGPSSRRRASASRRRPRSPSRSRRASRSSASGSGSPIPRTGTRPPRAPRSCSSVNELFGSLEARRAPCHTRARPAHRGGNP